MKRIKLMRGDLDFIKDWGEELHFIYFCVEVIRDELTEEEGNILDERADVVYRIAEKESKYQHRKIDNIVDMLLTFFTYHPKSHDEFKAEGIDIDQFEKWIITCEDLELRSETMKYEVYQEDSKKKLWRWRLWLTKDDNIGNSGEGFEDIGECLYELDIVRNSGAAPIYELDEDDIPISEIRIYPNGEWERIVL